MIDHLCAQKHSENDTLTTIYQRLPNDHSHVIALTRAEAMSSSVFLRYSVRDVIVINTTGTFLEPFKKHFQSHQGKNPFPQRADD